MSESSDIPGPVLGRYSLDPASIVPLHSGHINLSFAATRLDAQPVVLQRVNPIFPAAVHTDIDAVTRHLKGAGLETPMLLRTDDDRTHLELGGEVWRVLSRVAGETREAITADREAREAGRVLGEFHRALADFEAPLAVSRPGVHDLPRHLASLERALAAHAGHPANADVARIADSIFVLAARIETRPALPPRLVHGDPKISNVVFSAGRGICLIDLDTIARMPVALELGDALRSWCNLAAEDSPDAAFSVERGRTALEGYREGAGGLLAGEEWLAVPAATLSIAAELAARFAADALNENFFAWDHRRFASASAHNLARATAQLELAFGIERSLSALREIVMTFA